MRDVLFDVKKTFLKTIVDKIIVDKIIVDKIIVKSIDNFQHELSIKFKFPYINDGLIYNDINDKSKGYILKDGSYSKKNFFNTTRLWWSSFVYGAFIKSPALWVVYDCKKRGQMLMYKILVTGGCGFIGSHLCERLAQYKNNDVYSLDNYSMGSVDNHVENVTYITGDTIDIDKLVLFRPDIVFHLGEYSRVEQSFDDIEKVWKYNKSGTFAVLEFVKKARCKIVYAGSSTKFADGGLGKSESPYAWTKASNTELVINFGVWFNVSYAITYFYNVYGNREIKTGKYATVIALFNEKMRNGEPLTIVSPGSQIRNFTHIDDIVSGLILVGANGFGDGFGIGCKESFSIYEIAKMFGGKIKMLPERKGNRMNASVITNKSEALGWKATKSVIDYIKELKKNDWRN